jgi:DNA-binding IclR family transcriptional regulator
LGALETLAHRGPDLSLTQLSEALELHKSTAHRLIRVLERHRLVEKNTNNGKYRLGLKLFELGTRAVSQLDLRERAHPFLEKVMLSTGETVHLCVYDEGEVVYVDKMEPARSVRMASTVGRRNPAYCTAVGKAMMAHLPEDEVEAAAQRHGMKRLTRNTICTLVELQAELAKVRAQGYAVDNEENEEGLSCVGAAVWGFSPYPMAAISVSGPTFRVTSDKIPLVAQAVMAGAAALSRELGHQDMVPGEGSPTLTAAHSSRF